MAKFERPRFVTMLPLKPAVHQIGEAVVMMVMMVMAVAVTVVRVGMGNGDVDRGGVSSMPAIGTYV